MSALLQLHLHSRLNTWLQLIGQRQLQDKTRGMQSLGFGTAYIRDLTVYLNEPRIIMITTHSALSIQYVRRSGVCSAGGHHVPLTGTHGPPSGCRPVLSSQLLWQHPHDMLDLRKRRDPVWRLLFLSNWLHRSVLWDAWVINLSISQIPQWIYPTIHHFGTQMCTFLLCVYCGIWDRSIVGFVNLVCCSSVKLTNIPRNHTNKKY